MSRFIKILIIINGLIIPAFCCVLLYKLLADYITSGSSPEESVIVGESLEQAKKDSVALQGISYGDPIPVYNSTNFYLPVSVKTYEEPKRVSKLAYGNSMKFDDDYSDQHINVLFLDKDYKPIGKLLGKKASISEIRIGYNQYGRDEEVDKTVKNIAYLIAFEDSNKDGRLNSDDDHDLYISDLEGLGLTRVTAKQEVVSYDFVKSNSAILVKFKEKGSDRDEHKNTRFALYDIAAKTLTPLADVHKSLEEIESILIK